MRILFRFVVYFILFLLLRSLLRSFLGGMRTPLPRDRAQGRPQGPPPVPAGGELKKDPVCGTYVSTAASVTRTVHGEVLHFCSKECRDQYGKPKEYGHPKADS